MGVRELGQLQAERQGHVLPFSPSFGHDLYVFLIISCELIVIYIVFYDRLTYLLSRLCCVVRF